MKVVERDKKIKQELQKVFKKVKVKTGKGTDYGWVYTTIYEPKEEIEKKERIRIYKEVNNILEKTGLLNEIYTKEVIINVEFK